MSNLEMTFWRHSLRFVPNAAEGINQNGENERVDEREDEREDERVDKQQPSKYNEAGHRKKVKKRALTGLPFPLFTSES